LPSSRARGASGRRWVAVLVGAVLVACLPGVSDTEQPAGVTGTAERVPTVGAAYAGLSTGPLWDAKLVDLPEGVLLRAGEVRITAAELDAALAKYAAEGGVGEQLRQWRFYLLEEMAVEALLRVEARAWAGADGAQRATVVEDYLQSIADAVKIDEAQVRAHYEQNRQAFGTASYDEVAGWIASYLLDDLQRAAVTQQINRLSERHEVEVDRAFVAAAAESELANPVAQARSSGLPTMVDFGSHGCVPCDMMTPILAELKTSLAGRCNVLFVEVREEPILGGRYGVRSIPVQVFFDASGREVFRHVGYWPKESILNKLREMGVEQ